MSDFLYHQECPRCGDRGEDTAKDNLGVFDDGHQWCFKCGFFVPSDPVSNFSRELQEKQQEERETIVLPSDFTNHLPDDVVTWLTKYITREEINRNHIGWRYKHAEIVYPFYDLAGNLLCYQTRGFQNGSPTRRFHTEGKVEKVFHILGPATAGICVVEDILSAIKISRHMSVMPLLGSVISGDRLVVLSIRFLHLLIWLDSDKAKYSMKRAKAAEPFFESVRSIITELDPKEYDDGRVRDFIAAGETNS